MDPMAQVYQDRDEVGRVKARKYRKPPMRFRCSELSDCARRIWYRLSGYTPTPRYGHSEDYAVFGDLAHDVVRFSLRDHGAQLSGLKFDDDKGTVEELDKCYGYDYEYEGTKISLSGRGDGRIHLPAIDTTAYLEIKSLGYHKYMKLNWAHASKGQAGVRKIIDEFHPGFLYQTTAMMKMLNLNYSYIVFVDRSNCYMGVRNKDDQVTHGGYEYAFDPVIWDKVLQRCSFIAERVRSGEPPMPGNIYSSSECGYCPFKYLCRGAEYRRKRGLEPTVLYPDPAIDVEVDPEGGGIL